MKFEISNYTVILEISIIAVLIGFASSEITENVIFY